MSTLSRVVGTFLVALTLWVGAATAQDQGAAPDYEAWNTLAARAERMLEGGLASDSLLEALRRDVAGFRDLFTASQTENAARIETVQAQLSALGPVPEDGSERPEISQRRQELSDRLAQLQAPGRLAEEAGSRANGIISEIDTVLRSRQTNELLELGPSPLNPVGWTQAVQDMVSSLLLSWSELRENLASPEKRDASKGAAPVVLVMVAIALLLLIRGPGWVRAGVAHLRARVLRIAGLASYLASLGLILLPMTGVFLIAFGLLATEMHGPRWELLSGGAIVWAFLLFGIRWLAEQCFSEDDDVALLPLPGRRRTKARRVANLLAMAYVAMDVLEALTSLDSYSPSTMAVANFPLLLAAGFLLFRLGRIARTDTVAGLDADASSEPEAFRIRLAHAASTALMTVGIAGPLAAAIGYRQIAELFVLGTIETLSVVGALLVLQRLVEEVYFVITGRTARESNSLWTVLAGWALMIAALPYLALIWGARSSDISELWTRFSEGFSIGTTRISPTSFLTFVVIFAIGYTVTRVVQGALRTSLLPKTKLDPGGQVAIVSGVGYIGVFLAALAAITTAGIDLSGLAIVAGALSVGIGFGLQTVVSNFVSGIILLIERPIAEGDWIEVGGRQGYVRNISVRSTRIETFDRSDVIVPNADLISGTVTNFTRGKTVGRVIVPVGVAYGTDTRKVESILREVAEAQPMVILSPPPSILFVGFGADSLNFEIRAILRDVNWSMSTRSEMNHEIARRFAEEGIEIPFAQRDIWLRNPEALAKVVPPRDLPADDPEDDGDGEGDAAPGNEGNPA